MRKSCLICARKHLSQAMVLILEAKKAKIYEKHRWYACGHLAEAEDETVMMHPEIARRIRDQRLLIEKEIYDMDETDRILELLTKLIEVQEEGAKK